ncbi:MAG: hypothetical protein HYX22_01120 [Candidatus Yanofskybacteria bacterium]|nr:hypothetical protein [Candidatus Yanofskybacteria bacterium]
MGSRGMQAGTSSLRTQNLNTTSRTFGPSVARCRMVPGVATTPTLTVGAPTGSVGAVVLATLSPLPTRKQDFVVAPPRRSRG